MFKKAIKFGSNWMKEYLADCEDHRKNGTNYFKKYWYLYLGFLGILFSIGHFITDPMRKAKKLEKKMTESK